MLSHFKASSDAFQRAFFDLLDRTHGIATAEEMREFADYDVNAFSKVAELRTLSTSDYLRRAADVVENLEAWYAAFELKAPEEGEDPQWRDFLYIHLFAFINDPLGEGAAS